MTRTHAERRADRFRGYVAPPSVRRSPKARPRRTEPRGEPGFPGATGPNGPRWYPVLRAIAAGEPLFAIARALGVSPSTVSYHIEALVTFGFVERFGRGAVRVTDAGRAASEACPCCGR